MYIFLKESFKFPYERLNTEKSKHNKDDDVIFIISLKTYDQLQQLCHLLASF